ncbi:spore germination protein PF [Mesobacillus persicus]|uniref:Spore germination protein PF n=1 Tax=Mesobacillus persicus TaxID=930146 RepID=A0A1H7Z5D6_9BACI|nr:spore germination protein [Mesobacillus persicus]SEM53204.1 spore germination protein PF [Mesobacillus persicus]
MPVIIGSVYIGKIEGGTVHFGDVRNCSPNNSSESVSGQGEDNSGGYVYTNNGVNERNRFER